MNFIIDAEGKIIDLKDNILAILADDQKSLISNLKLQQLLSGLPEIFPIIDDSNLKTYKNLVLKKDLGSFGTNPTQTFYSLSIQPLHLLSSSAFLCYLEKYVSEVDMTLAANQKCFNLYLKYLKGSLFEIDPSSRIIKILSDGPEGILQKFGIVESFTLLDLLDFSLAKEFKSKLEEVIAEKKEIILSHRFRTRNWELYIDCKLNYKDDNCIVVYILDVTEKTKTIAERESFARFPRENPSPIVRVNRIGKITFANKSGINFCQKIGVKNKFFSNPDVRAIIKACIYDNNPRDLKIKLNKEYYYLTFSPNKENNDINIYGANITYQERIAEKLNKKTADLNSILNSSDDIILVVNGNLELLYYNNQSVKILKEFGIKKVERVMSFLQLIPNEIKDSIIDNSTIALNKNAIIKKDFALTDAKNNRRNFNTTFFPVINKSTGNSIGVCIQLKEITETEKAKKELISLKNFYQKILNNLPTDIAVLDKDYNYLFINPQAISNRETREWLIGKNDYDYADLKNIKSDFADRRKNIFNDVVITGITRSFEDLHIQNDGKNVYILRKYYPVYNDKKELEMMLGYGLDITSIKESELAAKHSEEELRLANTKLQKNYSQLMQYSYIVSHNLRAPIANLVGLSSFFQDTGHEKNNMIIQHIKESSERIDEILKDLNSILAIKEELNQSFEEISLLNIIDQVKSDLKNEIEDSDASINLNFDRIDKINSIRSFIHSIFYNLMSNSIKYRDKNKKCIIAINASINDGIITIKFSDNGIGIDLTKNKDKVFGLYKRFHKDVAEGTGVGLHLIKEQIESLGGNIKIESALGEGTTFTIELNEIKYVKNPVD